MILAPSVAGLFNWRQFEPEVILLAGLVSAVFTFVPRRGGTAGRAGPARRSRHGVGMGTSVTPRKWNGVCARGSDRPTTVGGWTLTYIRVKGKWVYLYRAVDSSGATIDFLLSAKRDAAAAERFLAKALAGTNPFHPAAHQHRQACRLPAGDCATQSRGCSGCHLQLNRGAAHLEINFAVNSRSRVPVLQLSRGAMASHFVTGHVPLSHTLERTPGQISLVYGSYGGLEPALAHALFRKALCI